ncbi:MAG TPA: hypothetical protein VGB66_04365, partial [Longimicrobium sp.]
MNTPRTYRQLTARLVGALVLLLAAVALRSTGLLAQVPTEASTGIPVLAFMGTVDTALMDSAMKVMFEDSVVNNVVTDSEVLHMFEADFNIKEEETTGGRYIETAQYFALPAGVGARAEGEYIPVPRGPVIRNSRIYLRKIQAVAEMTGDVMRRVKGDEGAFLNWAERHLPEIVKRLDSECDRMCIGYGAGAKARIAAIDNADPAAPIITLQDSFGLAGLSDAWLNFLAEETNVFSASVNGTALRAAGPGQAQAVKAVLTRENKVRYHGALPAGTVVGDYIFAGDAAGASTRTAGGQNREFLGLLGLVDDGAVISNFQGINRSEFPTWSSQIFDATANGFTGKLTEELVQFADDETQQHGGGKITVLLTSRKGLRDLWKDMKQQRSINDPRGAYTAGMKSIEIILGDRTIMVKVARKIPPQLTFGLSTSTFKRWMLGKFQWDDTTGSIWNRVSDGVGRKDAFYAVGN